jgi:hypothetical protein
MTHELADYNLITKRMEKLNNYAWEIENLCKNYKFHTDDGWVRLTLQERKEKIRTLMIRMYEELEGME